VCVSANMQYKGTKTPIKSSSTRNLKDSSSSSDRNLECEEDEKEEASSDKNEEDDKKTTTTNKRKSNKFGIKSKVKTLPNTAIGSLKKGRQKSTHTFTRSKPGQKFLKELFPDGFQVLQLITDVTCAVDSKKQSKKVKECMLEVALEVGILYKQKAITQQTFETLKMPILELWSLAIDFVEMSFCVDINVLQTLIWQTSVTLQNVLYQHISEKLFNVLVFTMTYFSSDELLLKVFTSEDKMIKDVRKNLAQSLRKYWDSGVPSADKALVHKIQAERACKPEKTTWEYFKKEKC